MEVRYAVMQNGKEVGSYEHERKAQLHARRAAKPSGMSRWSKPKPADIPKRAEVVKIERSYYRGADPCVLVFTAQWNANARKVLGSEMYKPVKTK